MTITLEKALELGFVLFVDDRRFCADCAMHKANAYMGKCNKNLVQYSTILNRCNSFTEKVLQSAQVIQVIAPNTKEKPFWEI